MGLKTQHLTIPQGHDELSGSGDTLECLVRVTAPNSLIPVSGDRPIDGSIQAGRTQSCTGLQ